MSHASRLASLLLLTTIFCPAAALAQSSGASPPLQTPPTGPAAGDETQVDAPGTEAQTGEAAAEPEVEISTPGANAGPGDIVVRGRRNIIRATPEVVSVLSSEDIARTGDGDIAGALARVPGLSIAGNGFVYVRGLGDRYSLALLNGLALPSPEPLRRVVPLDLFPTSVVASALVQKSYSVNFPGEFGGGVINLTTSSSPREPFLSVGASISGSTETTGRLGYTYYGSRTDVLGFDNGDRAVDGIFEGAFNSGNPISQGSNFSRAQIQAITADLTNSRTSVVQRNDEIPVNYGYDLSGGTSFDVGGLQLGLIGSAGFSNSWRTRDAVQQTGTPGEGTDYRAVRTDNRVVANGLAGLSAKFSGHNLRFTNLLIRDTLKVARIAAGFDAQLADPVPGQPPQQTSQRTAWFERQLFNTQLVGEFDFGDIDVDVRGGYANSKRNAPYERNFNYLYDPAVGDYVNNLTVNGQSASISFSELDEDVWNGGGDISYTVPGDRNITLSVGGAYLDTTRTSTRRDFVFRPGNALPRAVTQQRPDFLLSDFNVQTFDIQLAETSAGAGVARYQGDLTVSAGYGQVTANILDNVRFQGGVRYEDGKQSVTLIDLFNQGGLSQVAPIEKSYFLPAATLTWTVRPDMQLRVHGSKTLGRPQFRELAPQLYFDTESDRQFFGNPFITDSTLLNGEARYEWYFQPGQRFSVAGFYKRIENPIEALANVAGGGALLTTFGNAPRAILYGAEVEAQKYLSLSSLGLDSHRLVLIGNYTYSKSEIQVRDGDTTILNDLRGARPASEVFFDGDPLTGQSQHIANAQIGIENTASLQQLTMLFNYASERVSNRGQASGGLRQDDIVERPGLTIDLVARQAFRLLGGELEVKFEGRNLTNQAFEETQDIGDSRIFINRYKLGRSLSLGASLKF